MWGKLFYSSGLAGFFSLLVGYIAKCPIPLRFRSALFRQFSTLFGVNLNEVEHHLITYRSFDEFFTRSLRKESRVIDADPCSVVSPVDGVLLAFGSLSADQIIQAKGVNYSLKELLGPLTLDRYHDGYFLTFYLSPKDCHRIFSPISGVLTRACWVPGKLFPVREPYISGFPGLYTKNERLITELSTKTGSVAVVKVGAFNVGRISLPFDPTFVTHRFTKKPKVKVYSDSLSLEKGQWLGTFHLGSTVVLIFEKDGFNPDALSEGKSYCYGEHLGWIR